MNNKNKNNLFNLNIQKYFYYELKLPAIKGNAKKFYASKMGVLLLEKKILALPFTIGILNSHYENP